MVKALTIIDKKRKKEHLKAIVLADKLPKGRKYWLWSDQESFISHKGKDGSAWVDVADLVPGREYYLRNSEEYYHLELLEFEDNEAIFSIDPCPHRDFAHAYHLSKTAERDRGVQRLAYLEKENAQLKSELDALIVRLIKIEKEKSITA